MSTQQQNLRERIATNWPAEIAGISTRALAAIDTLSERTAGVNPRRLSTTELDALLAGQKDIGRTLAVANAEIATAQAKLVDKFAALRSRALEWPSPRAKELSGEIAAHIRALPLSDKTELLFPESGAPNPDIVRAVLERPAYLTGIPLDRLAQLESELLASQFPEESAALDMTAEAIEHAKASSDALAGELARRFDFQEHELALWVETQSPPPPVIDRTEEILERQINESDAAFVAALLA